MGLEIVVLFLMTLFFFGGLVAPVTLWLVWSLVQRQRFVEGLKLNGMYEVEDAGEESAEVPVRVWLSTGERRVSAAALVKNGVGLWHLRVPLDGRLPCAFGLVREEWDRPLPELRCLPTAIPLHGQPFGFDLHVFDAPALQRLTGGRLSRAAAHLTGSSAGLVQCALLPTELIVELRREDMTATDFLRGLRRVWRFGYELGVLDEAQAPLSLRRSHEQVIGAGSGAPLALPG
jgi:hypothetical protein